MPDKKRIEVKAIPETRQRDGASELNLQGAVVTSAREGEISHLMLSSEKGALGGLILRGAGNKVKLSVVRWDVERVKDVAERFAHQKVIPSDVPTAELPDGGALALLPGGRAGALLKPVRRAMGRASAEVIRVRSARGDISAELVLRVRVGELLRAYPWQKLVAHRRGLDLDSISAVAIAMRNEEPPERSWPIRLTGVKGVPNGILNVLVVDPRTKPHAPGPSRKVSPETQSTPRRDRGLDVSPTAEPSIWIRTTDGLAIDLRLDTLLFKAMIEAAGRSLTALALAEDEQAAVGVIQSIFSRGSEATTLALLSVPLANRVTALVRGESVYALITGGSASADLLRFEQRLGRDIPPDLRFLSGLNDIALGFSERGIEQLRPFLEAPSLLSEADWAPIDIILHTNNGRRFEDLDVVLRARRKLKGEIDLDELARVELRHDATDLLSAIVVQEPLTGELITNVAVRLELAREVGLKSLIYIERASAPSTRRERAAAPAEAALEAARAEGLHWLRVPEFPLRSYAPTMLVEGARVYDLLPSKEGDRKRPKPSGSTVILVRRAGGQ